MKIIIELEVDNAEEAINVLKAIKGIPSVTPSVTNWDEDPLYRGRK